jgi:hypothetical protein
MCSSWAKRREKVGRLRSSPTMKKLILRTDNVKWHYFRVWHNCLRDVRVVETFDCGSRGCAHVEAAAFFLS